MRDLTVKDIAALSSTTELMDLEWAPCRYHCPVHADVRRYLDLAAQGRWQDSIDVIRANLPLACVCGRICHHPCETNCRRQDVDEPVAIREIKRHVAERQGAPGSTVHKAARQDKAKVAIIGAGPAGLAAALDLAKMGYRPTLFEKFPVAGGICATAIPKYRLPRDVLQADIDWILAHGAELVTGVEIGKDKTIADLKKDGFAAVLIATGLSQSRMLPLPGADHPQVHPVLEFLKKAAFDEPVATGQDVLVIGGGNVAVDAARSAVRLGAGRVRMMCLEDEKEMPAWSWEQREALEEGITFIHRRGSVEIRVRGGKITGVKARKVTRVFDENKRFNPAYDDRDTIELECDTVIMAIGQAADTGFVKGSDLAVEPNGRLAFNRATHQTSRPDVFACGEIVTPPGSAVEACASGQRAAKAIDLYLSGKDIRIDDALPPYIGKIDSPTAEKVIKVQRQAVPTEPPRTRRATFAEFDHNYSEPATLSEARRCMGCGSGAEVLADKCAACLTCLRVCPFDIPKIGERARIDSALCQACGICAAECPANAIISRGKDAGDLVSRTAKLLAGTTGRVIAYICGHHASAADWAGCKDLPGVTEIYIPSVAGVSTVDLLQALENGAEGVLVVAAKDGSDRYPDANRRLRKRVGQAREMLHEIGLDPEKIKMVELA